jgi:hypothetical protein
MKKVLLVALAIFAVSVFKVNAQDMIMKKDGNEIHARVIESDPVNVKYKLYDNQGGPTYVIPKIELFRIKYEDGRIEVFTSPIDAPTDTPTSGISVTPQSQTNAQPPFNPPVQQQVAPVTQYPYQPYNWKEQMQMKVPYMYQQYRKKNRLKNVGWWLIGGGALLSSVGFAVADKEVSRTSTHIEYELSGPGAALYAIGVTCTTTGLVLMIVGYSQRNKIKREFLSRSDAQYSQKPHFEIRPNGLAFVF